MSFSHKNEGIGHSSDLNFKEAITILLTIEKPLDNDDFFAFVALS